MACVWFGCCVEDGFLLFIIQVSYVASVARVAEREREKEGGGVGGGEPASVDCVTTPSLQETGPRIAGYLLAGLLAGKRAAWEFSVSGKGCC